MGTVDESLSYWEEVLKREDIKYEKEGMSTLHASVEIRDGDGHRWRDLWIEQNGGSITASVTGPGGNNRAEGLDTQGAINLFIRDKELFFTERD